MRFHSVPKQPDIVMWVDDDGASGITRAGEPYWAEYEAWCKAKKRTSPQAWFAQPVTLQAALQQVHAEAERVLATYRSGYPTVEIDSWPQQAAEAMAWEADSSTPTPLLSAILQPGELLGELSQKVLQRAVQYQQMVVAVIQWRRSAHHQLTALATQFEQGGITQVTVLYPEEPHAS